MSLSVGLANRAAEEGFSSQDWLRPLPADLSAGRLQ
jgi:hypothetical protein